MTRRRRRAPPALDLATEIPDVGAAGAPSAGGPFAAAARFTDFCAQLSVTLTPGQRVASLVAYDGLEPEDLEGEERAIAREMFGDIERLSPGARRVFVAVCGARGGKTYVLAALRLLHLALTVALTTLAPGEVASAPLIAPDKDLATQALRYIQGAIGSVPELAAMVLGKPDAAESIEILRDGHPIEIVVRAASGRGRTGRGRSLVGAVMEEAAFFRDADFQVNDEEIFKALRPRLLPGAQLVITSTPWAQVGLLYALFVANHPNPSVAGLDDKAQLLGTAIAMHATTLRLRDVPATREVVEAEEASDPDNAEREYGARFMSAGGDLFFDPLTLAKCVDDDLVLPFLPEGGDEVTCGGDLGFAKNSSALVITHRRTVLRDAVGADGKNAKVPVNLISAADIREKKPQQGAALKPSEVVREFADVIVTHHGSYLMADRHYRETAIEYLSAAGLGFVDAPTTPAEAFIAARAAMREDRVRIPNHPRLLRQLRETISRRGSGGTVTMVLPKWRTGEHGDLAVAFVLAVYQASGPIVPKSKPLENTPEWFTAKAAEMQGRRRESVRRVNERGEAWRPGSRK